jgi:hypothetical protein
MGCGCNSKSLTASLASSAKALARQQRGLVQYYFLKDASRLPPTASFTDPFDMQVYNAKRHESLEDFINRIQKSREEKGLIPIVAGDLKDLVEVSLVEGATKKELNLFFDRKSVPVSTSQVRSFAQNVIQELKSPAYVTYAQRQVRADKCFGCKLHKSRGTTNPLAMKFINTMLGLAQIASSDKEKELGSCGMCGCNLQSKIRLSVKSVIAGLLPEQLAKLLSVYQEKAFSSCWMLEEGMKDPHMNSLLASKIKHSGPATQHFHASYTNKVKNKNG